MGPGQHWSRRAFPEQLRDLAGIHGLFCFVNLHFLAKQLDYFLCVSCLGCPKDCLEDLRWWCCHEFWSAFEM